MCFTSTLDRDQTRATINDHHTRVVINHDLIAVESNTSEHRDPRFFISSRRPESDDPAVVTVSNCLLRQTSVSF